jgi:hypothetical protein
MHLTLCDARRLSAIAFILSAVPSFAATQVGPSPAAAPESVTVAAGTRYKAGALHRWFSGGTYRDLWTTPIFTPGSGSGRDCNPDPSSSGNLSPAIATMRWCPMMVFFCGWPHE